MNGGSRPRHHNSISYLSNSNWKPFELVYELRAVQIGLFITNTRRHVGGAFAHFQFSMTNIGMCKSIAAILALKMTEFRCRVQEH